MNPKSWSPQTKLIFGLDIGVGSILVVASTVLRLDLVQAFLLWGIATMIAIQYKIVLELGAARGDTIGLSLDTRIEFQFKPALSDTLDLIASAKTRIQARNAVLRDDSDMLEFLNKSLKIFKTEYYSRVMNRGASVNFILDHISASWKSLYPRGHYRLFFDEGYAGQIGGVLIDDNKKACLFLYVRRDACLYVESNNARLIGFAKENVLYGLEKKSWVLFDELGELGDEYDRQKVVDWLKKHRLYGEPNSPIKDQGPHEG